MLAPETLLTEYGNDAPLGDLLSYDDYAFWATSVLIRPNDISYYRKKSEEECQEFLHPTDNENTVEEAGDLIWTLVTNRELAYRHVGDTTSLEYQTASLASIAKAWVFEMDLTGLESWLNESRDLYLHKVKLAKWYGQGMGPELRREYVMDTVDALLPQMIAAITRIVELKTGRTIHDILRRNRDKLERRIATGTLHKAVRERLDSRV
jgi:hypothetical protein